MVGLPKCEQSFYDKKLFGIKDNKKYSNFSTAE